MAAWTIGVEVVGSNVDSARFVRLVDFLGREFPDYGTDCAMWSGRLAVSATVRAPTSPEALESFLNAIGLAFEETNIDMHGGAEIASVTLRPASVPRAADTTDSLPQALLRRLLSPHRLRRRT
jgi:hypothetical protein